MSPAPVVTQAATPHLSALILDDEKNIRATLALCLESMGLHVRAVAWPEESMRVLEEEVFDLAFLDLRLGVAQGLDVLPRWLAVRPGLDVIIITAYASIETAVEAMRRGARDYIPKPFTPAQIRQVVERVAEGRRLRGRISDLEAQLADSVPEARLETRSPAQRSAFETIERAADSTAPVLIRGESGTGKGVLARALHAASPRAAGPFVVVHCPALSAELLASELFGHARGAFTGAVRDQAGKAEAAHGGTLFLDEVGELTQGVQAQLLRFLQEKRFERLGETKTRTADVRIVCATNRDLEAAVRDGRFRLDLLYRLNVVEVVLPALRERRGDILPLARHFLDFFARVAGRPSPNLTPDADRALEEYAWPGNVRELRNEIERALVLGRSQTLDASAFSSRLAPPPEEAIRLGGDYSLERIEQEHIRRVLARTSTQEQAANILGIDVSTLWRKRKRSDAGAS